MTDIVERLRSRSRFDTCFPPETLMTMAADEIERLRNELAELRKAQGEPVAWRDDLDGEITDRADVAETWRELYERPITELFAKK